MEYMDNDRDLQETIKALEKIKSWAMSQLGHMRKPSEMEQGEVHQSGSEEMPPEEESFESEEPQEEMSIPVKEEKTIIAMGPKFKPSQSPEGMDSEIVKKLEKYGKKRR